MGGEIPDIIPVQPQNPNGSEQQGGGLITRRRLLYGAVGLAVCGGLGGVRALVGDGDPQAAPTTEPTEAATTETVEPAPSEVSTSPSPDEGAPIVIPEAVSQLNDLDERARTDTDGITSFFAIPGTVAGQTQASNTIPARLTEQNENGYDANVAFLSFGPGVNPNVPSTFLLRDYFNGMANAGVGAQEWGHVVVDGSAPDPNNAVSSSLRVARALQNAAPGTSMSLGIDIGDRGHLPTRLAAIQQNQSDLAQAGFDSLTVTGTNNESIQFSGGQADLSSYLNVDDIMAASIATGLTEIRISTAIPRRGANGELLTEGQRDNVAYAIGGVVEELTGRGTVVAGVSLRADNTDGHDNTFPAGKEGAYKTLHDRIAQVDPNIPLSTCVTTQ